MTEKNYNPQQKERKAMQKQEASTKSKKIEQPIEAVKKPEEEKKVENAEESKEQSKKEVPEKKPVKKETPKIKKTEVFVRGISMPVSTKTAKYICKFIAGKRLGDAIRDMEMVEAGKKAVPMKGEIPHRKGIMSGRFPKKSAKHFIILLKSLAANANEGNMDEPVIVESMANMAQRPYGRFGRTQKKRTHVKIIAKDKSQLKNKKKKKK